MTSLSLNKLVIGLTLGTLAALQACGGRGSDVIDPGNTEGASSCIGCGDGTGSTTSGDGDGAGDGDGGDGDTPDFGNVGYGEFELREEFNGPCEESATVDINLGNSAEGAVRAIHCQIFGMEPDQTTLQTWADDLREKEHVRRIDVAWTFCSQAGKACSLAYSDPWKSQVLLEETCEKKTEREMGAVFMYFSECPDGVNCTQYWANTHAVGMDSQHSLYAFESAKAGFYNPGNAGFWRRELLDARWAGLSFLMPNSYGPDIHGPARPLERAVEALEDIGGGIGLALFDDTWGWRTTSPEPFNVVPNFADTENAAQAIFTHKWKAFFDIIPEAHWYKHDGRPLIYFYNAGTLGPRDQAPGVIARAKELFQTEYGVEPYVVVDSAFFENEAGMNAVADGRFTWDTFRHGGVSRYNVSEETVAHRMVKWDALGRDQEGVIAQPTDQLHKGPELLNTFLQESADADIAVVATWNDLGEGTGINRNYDYYHQGEWLAPNHFMAMIRSAQCSN